MTNPWLNAANQRRDTHAHLVGAPLTSQKSSHSSPSSTPTERGAFAAFIAVHPDEGDVVQGTGGVRKVRWSRAGSGKSGGVRVVYFVRNEQGELVLLFMYAKAKLDTLKASTLKGLRDAVK